jgi:hypothetical protein
MRCFHLDFTLITTLVNKRLGTILAEVGGSIRLYSTYTTYSTVPRECIGRCSRADANVACGAETGDRALTIPQLLYSYVPQ